MSVTTPKENTVRISAPNSEPVSLEIDAAAPLTVRIEVEKACTCSSGSSRHAGSYTDTDFGVR
jgi:hypothetical protein